MFGLGVEETVSEVFAIIIVIGFVERDGRCVFHESSLKIVSAHYFFLAIQQNSKRLVGSAKDFEEAILGRL